MTDKPMTVGIDASELKSLRLEVSDIFNKMPIEEFNGSDKWSFIQGILCTLDYILSEDNNRIPLIKFINGA